MEKPPEKLYHYSKLVDCHEDWLRNVIVDNRVYCAHPSEFNDIYDSDPYHNKIITRDDHLARIIHKN